MSKVCFTVLLALMAADLSAQTQVPLRPADLASTNFPPRIDMRAEAIKLFDKDGDGKLSEEEEQAMREARRKMMMEKFDKDGDGELSEAERAEMRKEMGGRPGGPKGKGPKGKGGKGGKRGGADVEAPGAGE